MAIGPRDVGKQRHLLREIHEDLARHLEQGIDRHLATHPPGEPLRMQFSGDGNVEHALPIVAEHYRAAGWRRAVVQPLAEGRYALVLEP